MLIPSNADAAGTVGGPAASGAAGPAAASAAAAPGAGAAIGYLWLKCVSTACGHPASATTPIASAVVQWRFRSAWSDRESAKVASWISTEQPRARRAKARLGRQSPLYATPHLGPRR